MVKNVSKVKKVPTKEALYEELLELKSNLPKGEILDSVIYNIEQYEENPRNITRDELSEVLKTAELEFNSYLETVGELQQMEEEYEEREEEEEAAEEDAPITTQEGAKKILNVLQKATNNTTKVNNSVKNAPKNETKVSNTPVKKIGIKTPLKNNVKKLEAKEHEIFKNSYYYEGIGTFELRNKKYQTVEEIYLDMQEGKELVIGMYWTEAQIKQYDYNEGTFRTGEDNELCEYITKFENDLDFYQITYIAQNLTGLLGMSYFSERLTRIDNADLKEIKGIRYVNMAEYQIYELVNSELNN